MDLQITASEIVLRLLVSLLIGIAIGIEREVAHKAAGLRTSVLICLGATIFTLAGLEFNSVAQLADPSRIAAQIVTGIGFLGAGAIIQTRASVHGLTTAAAIWVMASIGIAVGIGAYVLALGGTFIVLLVLIPLQAVEHALKGKKSTYIYTLEASETGPVMQEIMNALRNSPGEVKSVKVVRQDNSHRIRFYYTDQDSAHTSLLEKLSKTDGVVEVDTSQER